MFFWRFLAFLMTQQMLAIWFQLYHLYLLIDRFIMFIANIFWIIEKVKEFQKKSTSASLSISKPVTVWITTKCGKFLFFFIGKIDFYFKIVHWHFFIRELSFVFLFLFLFLKRWNTRPTSLSPGKPICGSRRNTMTGSKLGKEYNKAIYYHPAYFTYMQSTSYKMLGWINHKIESRSLGEISRTSERNIKNHSNGRNWGRAKECIDESERGEWKSWLETQSKK